MIDEHCRWTPQDIINDLVWESVGPDGAMSGFPFNDSETEFNELSIIIQAILSNDEHALGAALMQQARSYLIAHLNDKETFHEHDLIGFLKSRGFNVPHDVEDADDD